MLAWLGRVLQTLRRGRAGAGAEGAGREGTSDHRLSFSHASRPPQTSGEACEDLRLPVLLKLILKKKKRCRRKLLEVMDMLMACGGG